LGQHVLLERLGRHPEVRLYSATAAPVILPRRRRLLLWLLPWLLLWLLLWLVLVLVLLFHLLLPLLLHLLLHLLVHLLLHLQKERNKIYSISGRISEG
jgi:hypothetical protein